MPVRGTNREEVIHTIRQGERQTAKKGRKAYRKNFPYEKVWKGKYYAVKQLLAIVAETDIVFVITVYTFFWGGKNEDQIRS